MSGWRKPVTLAEWFRVGMVAQREVDVIAWRIALELHPPGIKAEDRDALAVLLGRVAQAVRDRKDRPAG